jgi:adenylate cyclase
MRANTLFIMGRPEDARVMFDKLLAANREIGGLSRELAYGTLAEINWALGDSAATTKWSDLARRTAEESEEPHLMIYGRLWSGLGQAARNEFPEAMETFADALQFARDRHAPAEAEARILCHLAHVELQAGLADRARATAAEAAAIARRGGVKVWMAYAEWLIGGPSAPPFKQLVAETGAEFLLHLPDPRNSRPVAGGSAQAARN